MAEAVLAIRGQVKGNDRIPCFTGVLDILSSETKASVPTE